MLYGRGLALNLPYLPVMPVLNKRKKKFLSLRKHRTMATGRRWAWNINVAEFEQKETPSFDLKDEQHSRSRQAILLEI